MEIIGIHDLGQTTSPTMYTGRQLSWLRENAQFRPWQTWRVPVASRPTQRVVWRDLVILDENNEFYAVQSLTAESLTIAANRLALTNVLKAAASVTDVDVDGLPDKWEIATYGSIEAEPNQLAPNGQPNLLAYALGYPTTGAPESLDPKLEIVIADSKPCLQWRFRRRLGLVGRELIEYRPERTADFLTWDNTGWTEVSRFNPWDGTGTEIVELRSPIGVGSPDFGFSRLRVTTRE
ncbi:MAG: hypothetical protein ACKV19_01345 [Verrucomicrobiales bacterium]